MLMKVRFHDRISRTELDKSTRHDAADNQWSASWFNRSPIIHTPFARGIFST